MLLLQLMLPECWYCPKGSRIGFCKDKDEDPEEFHPECERLVSIYYLTMVERDVFKTDTIRC